VLLTFLEKFTFSLVSGCCQDKFEHYWKKKFWFVTIPSMCPLFIFRVILLLRQRLYIVWKHNNPQHSQQLNPIHSVESFPYSVKQKLSSNFCFIFSVISFTLKIFRILYRPGSNLFCSFRITEPEGRCTCTGFAIIDLYLTLVTIFIFGRAEIRQSEQIMARGWKTEGSDFVSR
jgi:hypothetical protein